MNSYQSVILLMTCVLAYIMIVDQNVSDYLLLIFKITKINFSRFFWMLRLHPKNPITNLIKEREYAKLAKELEKELMKK